MFYFYYKYVALENDSLNITIYFFNPTVKEVNIAFRRNVKVLIFLLDYFFNSKLCLIYLLQFFFKMRSSSLFYIEVFYYICPRNNLFNFFIHNVHSFSSIWSVTFRKNVFYILIFLLGHQLQI